MAGPTDIDADLALELNGEGITPSVFKEGVNSFVGLLGVLTRSVCGKSPPVEWRMQGGTGSNLIGARAEHGSDQSRVLAICELAVDCLRPLGRDGTAEGSLCPDAAQEYVRKLAKLQFAPGTRIRIWIGAEPYEIDLALVKPRQATPHKRVGLPGTVEGRLSALHDRGDIYIEVCEYIRDRPIKCIVGVDLIEKCRELWRRRVTVRGIVYYDSEGIPAKVEASDVVPLTGSGKLPSHMEVLGILRKYLPRSSSEVDESR